MDLLLAAGINGLLSNVPEIIGGKFGLGCFPVWSSCAEYSSLHGRILQGLLSGHWPRLRAGLNNPIRKIRGYSLLMHTAGAQLEMDILPDVTASLHDRCLPLKIDLFSIWISL